MADDLDALLDEVENKFCRLSRRDYSERLRASQGRKRDRLLEKEEEAEAEAAAAGERARFTKILTKGANEEEDIDEIIKDIDESTYIRNFTKQTPRLFCSSSENNNTSIQTLGKKCCPVYLGGSTAPYGIGTNISQRTCDQLRCTACDFRVLNYNDYQWDKSCDYLFFRNKRRILVSIEIMKLLARLFRVVVNFSSAISRGFSALQRKQKVCLCPSRETIVNSSNKHVYGDSQSSMIVPNVLFQEATGLSFFSLKTFPPLCSFFACLNTHINNNTSEQ